MKLNILASSLLSLATAQVTFQNSTGTILRTDNGTYGPEIEEYHYYYDQWPIGLAVSSTGRLFVCYTRGNYTFTLGEATNQTAEEPYPSADLNLPVSQLNTSYNGIPFGSSNSTGFISVQALYITPENDRRPETLWVVDTGRPTITNAQGAPSMPYGQPGGPKIIGIALSNDSVYATYTFPPSVHFPDSYMNDIRFDLRSNITEGGQGVAYIVDSSDEGRPGFIMLDLATGESWRRLTQHPSTLRVNNDVPSYQGHPFYQHTIGQPISHLQEGLDGIQISPNGETCYYSPLTGNYLYSIPTRNLLARDTDPLAEQAAHNNVSNLGQRGGNANGFEGDSNGLIYQLVPEHNAIYYYDPKDLQIKGFVRDSRIIWPDSAAIGEDGYFYMNINQLPYQPNWNGGVDGRMHPGAVLRARLLGNGTKITSLA
ncbi:major royal jelly protein-domain-containing protein [Lophiotrema nucula]|uniref:Major royal jelly protein-domain-containing protein n=1 Tax=Lophiotrema nucula TaxID=690887 RepID=A0A6A5ZTF3_9PLEO|nr:major royal jelly protein-domain-containing protein [Lophiotrema nucula]